MAADYKQNPFTLAYQPVEKLTSQGIIGKLNSRLIFLRRLS